MYAPQEQFTFAVVTGVIDDFGLSIADARVIPLDNEQSFSIYTILEQDGQPIEEASRREKVRQRLLAALLAEDTNEVKVSRKAPRQVRMFQTSTRVNFAEDARNQRTVLELVAGDRPGLLAETSQIFRRLSIFIRMAKIVTVGERAEDVFYVTDSSGKPLSNDLQEKIRAALVSAEENKR